MGSGSAQSRSLHTARVGSGRNTPKPLQDKGGILVDKSFNEAGINKVLHGDCLELMKDIPEGSIDMILCDLPYGTTACKWDTIIPFEPLWAHYKRLIKPNGAIVLTASQPFTSKLVMSNLGMFKYEWIWEKYAISGHLNAKIMPLKKHENVLIFCQGKTNYNPQMTKGTPYNVTYSTHSKNYGK
jgi:site-specific DNA-methyltransferase (adenine-specific)